MKNFKVKLLLKRVLSWSLILIYIYIFLASIRRRWMDRRGERIAHFLDFQDRRLQNLVWGKAERRGIIHNRGAAAAWTTARVWKVAEAHVCVKPRMGKGRYHGYTYGFRWRTPPLEQSRLNTSIVGQGYRSLSLSLFRAWNKIIWCTDRWKKGEEREYGRRKGKWMGNCRIFYLTKKEDERIIVVWKA